jgi:hypothetical protein
MIGVPMTKEQVAQMLNACDYETGTSLINALIVEAPAALKAMLEDPVLCYSIHRTPKP